jgi:hypothetical protein
MILFVFCFGRLGWFWKGRSWRIKEGRKKFKQKLKAKISLLFFRYANFKLYKKEVKVRSFIIQWRYLFVFFLLCKKGTIMVTVMFIKRERKWGYCFNNSMEREADRTCCAFNFSFFSFYKDEGGNDSSSSTNGSKSNKKKVSHASKVICIERKVCFPSLSV